MNKNNFRDIDIMNVIWKCLYQWKPALVFSIIVGLVTMFGIYYKNISEYNFAINSISSGIVSSEQIAQDLTEEQLEFVDNVATTAINLKQRKEYLLKSALMHVDPYAERLLVINYTIENTDGEPVVAVMDSLNSSLMSNDLYNSLASVIDDVDDSIYIAELLSSSYTTGDMTNVGAFNIRVILTGDTDANDIVDVVDKYINERVDNLSSVASIDVSQTNAQVATIVNTDLSNAQKTQRDTITSLNSTLTSLESALDDNQKQVYESIVHEQENTEFEMNDEQQELISIAKPGPSVKCLVLGFVLGIIIYFCVILFIEVFKSKIDTASEIADLYGIRNLGEVHGKRYYSRIDRFIYSQFIYDFRNKNKFDLVSQLEEFKKNANVLAEHKCLQNIKFVDISGDKDAEVPITADDAKNNVGIVLVIESGVSKFINAEKVIRRARDFEMPIIGVYSVE